MKITDIYDKYKIMPQLRTHMFRVTSIALFISSNFKLPLDNELITSSCLLHDMGNIIKFNLEEFPKYNEPLGIDHWKKIQNYFIKKYGTNEHLATFKIIKELGVPKEIENLVGKSGFSKGESIFKSTQFELKIVSYSDHRTTPKGITSLGERFNDVEIRYKERIVNTPNINFQKLCYYWTKIEEQIFKRCKIKPENISEEKVKPFLEKLKDFEIKTNKT